jgi:hypothetical protein
MWAAFAGAVALFHGMTQFYQELLTVRRGANEVYLLPAPEELVRRNFAELSEMFLQYRNDRRSCLSIGIQHGDEIFINPIADEAGSLHSDDQFILLSRILPGNTPPSPRTHRSRYIQAPCRRSRGTIRAVSDRGHAVQSMRR